MSPLLFALMIAPKPVLAKAADVLKTPTKYDGKAIVVKGRVKSFKAKASRDGNAYYLFDLVDGTATLKVYGGNALGKPPKDGDTVAVTGRYAHERKVGDRTYEDEIDASTRLDKTFGVKTPAK